MIQCKMEDEHNEEFPMAQEVSLCAVPFTGCEIAIGSRVYEVRKVQIDSAFVWLTVRFVGE